MAVQENSLPSSSSEAGKVHVVVVMRGTIAPSRVHVTATGSGLPITSQTRVTSLPTPGEADPLTLMVRVADGGSGKERGQGDVPKRIDDN